MYAQVVTPITYTLAEPTTPASPPMPMAADSERIFSCDWALTVTFPPAVTLASPMWPRCPW